MRHTYTHTHTKSHNPSWQTKQLDMLNGNQSIIKYSKFVNDIINLPIKSHWINDKNDIKTKQNEKEKGKKNNNENTKQNNSIERDEH